MLYWLGLLKLRNDMKKEIYQEHTRRNFLKVEAVTSGVSLLGFSNLLKHLFTEQDCLIIRLMEVCDDISISFTEMMDLAAKQGVTPTTLSLNTE